MPAFVPRPPSPGLFGLPCAPLRARCPEYFNEHSICLIRIAPRLLPARRLPHRTAPPPRQPLRVALRVARRRWRLLPLLNLNGPRPLGTHRAPGRRRRISTVRPGLLPPRLLWRSRGLGIPPGHAAAAVPPPRPRCRIAAARWPGRSTRTSSRLVRVAWTRRARRAP